MPQILMISDVPETQARRTGMLAPKTPAPRSVPLRSLRTDVKIASVRKSQIQTFLKMIRAAKMQKAVSGIRLALVALANRRFEEAGRIAINAAIQAVAAHKGNSEMATRIVTTARGVIEKAIRGITARTA